MKKLLILCFVIQLLSSVSAQQWCSPGSVWHFNTSNSTFNTTYTKQTYLYDTIVSGKTFNKIASERHGNGVMGPINDYYNFYTSLQNSVVFFNSADYGTTPIAADTLMYFGPVGAKWRVQPNGGTSCALSYIEITETGNSLVQGTTLNWCKISYSNYYMFGTPSQYLETGTDTIFERIGYKHIAFQFIGHCADGTDVTASKFNCFSDNLISVKTVTTNCDLTTSINEQIFLNPEFTIYPQPASSVINISVTNLSENNLLILEIENAFGQTVNSVFINQNETQLNVNALSAGIYFFKLKSKNAVVIKKFIKQ